jgi:DNA-binding CsgD family transcriptional regulator
LNTLLSTLPGVVRALGAAGFERALLEALHGATGAAHLAIIAFDHQLLPQLIAAESRGSTMLARSAGRAYFSGLFYRHDPTRGALRQRPAGAETETPLLLRLAARDIKERAWRQQIYERYGLEERVSLLGRAGSHWLALNVYRGTSDGPFADEQLRSLHGSAALLLEMIARHYALRPPVTWRRTARPPVARLEDLLGRIDARLTRRQVQVCARALIGMTNVAIGLDLGVRAPTVATLRQRAYATLGISGLNELFGLCLAQAAAAG